MCEFAGWFLGKFFFLTKGHMADCSFQHGRNNTSHLMCSPDSVIVILPLRNGVHVLSSLILEFDLRLSEPTGWKWYCDIWQPDIKLPSFQFCSFGLLASQSQHLCWEEVHTSLCQETPWRDHVQMFWLPVQRRSQSTVSTSHKTTRQVSEDILQTPPLNHAQTSGLPPWGPKHCGAETTFSHCARHKSPCHRICEHNRMVVFMLLSFGVIYFTSGVCAWLSSFSQPWF